MSVFHNRNIIAPNKKDLLGGLLCWSVYLFLPFFLILSPFFRDDSLRTQFLFELTVSVLVFLLVLAVFRTFLYRSKLPFPLLLLTCFFGFIGTQALSGLWGILLYSLQSLLPEAPTNMNQETVNVFLESYKVPMILNVVVFAPVVEEFLFRGVIFAPLCKKSPFLGYAVSMIVFAGFHVIGYIGVQHWSLLVFSMLQYLPSAFVLCWSYQRSHSILAPIFLHGILNLYSTIFILS